MSADYADYTDVQPTVRLVRGRYELYTMAACMTLPENLLRNLRNLRMTLA